MSWAPDNLDFTNAAAATNLATPGSYWRIFEYSGYDFDGSSPHYDTATERYDFDVYPWFGAGRVADDGSLTGFPNPYIPSQQVPYVVPPAGIVDGMDFAIGLYCQTGCLNEDDGLIYWHQYSASHPDGINQMFLGYRLTSPASDWP